MGKGSAAPEQVGKDFVQDPFALYDRLRAEGPVREVLMPRGLKVWLVTRYEEAREALADVRLNKDMREARDLFRRHSTPAADNGEVFPAELAAHMLNSDPPDHTRLRKLVAKAFTMRRVELMRPRIEEITQELLDGLAGRDRVDLLNDFAFPLPVAVICELLGIPYADRDDFRRWSNALVSGGREEGEVSEAAVAMATYLSKLIAGKRDAPVDDLLSALVQVRDEGDDRLNEVELLSMGFLLLVAGHETTVNLIGNGLFWLLRNPDQLATLRADPDLLPQAIEEFLRFDGPVNHATLRYTTAPVRLGGTEIPAGEFVVVALTAANRDGERFADPDRLDITRAAGGHLAFGHGIHFCLGAPLARLEGQIAIGRLLARFPALALAVDPAELRWRHGTLLRGLERLPVRLR